MFFICHRIHNIEKNTFQKICIFQRFKSDSKIPEFYSAYPELVFSNQPIIRLNGEDIPFDKWIQQWWECYMMDNKVNHLEMIQGVISRMASNSFALKGWAVTLVAGIFALSSKDADKLYFLVAYIPIIVFCISYTT